MEEKKSFPCSSCGAQLEYAPGESLKCPYCGHENPIPQSEADIQELDFQSAMARLSQEQDLVEEQTVRCDACGAKSVLEPNVSLSHCPFCGTTLHSAAQVSRAIKAESLLPFKVKKHEALTSFRQWLKGLWFAPGKLVRYAQAEGNLKGVYIPYWTFDTQTKSFYRGERGEDYTTTETYRTKDAQGRSVTRTRHVTKTRWHSVQGVVWRNFDDVLVVASESIPRAMVERLEPWDVKDLVPYQEEFLSGFQCEAYQVDLAQGFELGKQIMAKSIEGDIRRDIGGDHQRISSVKTQYDHITFKHVMLPIWINAYRYAKKSYRFIVNGRTGEVQGDRPWSAIKITLAVLAALAAAGLIFLMFRGG